MTRVKTNIKLVIMLGLALLTICIFNTTVNATDEKTLKEVVDFVSSQTITLDVPSSNLNILGNSNNENFMPQAAQASLKATEKVEELCVQNGISKDKLSVIVWLYGDTLDYADEDGDFKFSSDRLYKPRTTITYDGNEAETTVNVKFSDNSKYNTTTANKIKSVIDNDSSKYIVIDFEDLKEKSKSKQDNELWYSLISEYYQEKLNDKAITATLISHQGGSSKLGYQPDTPTLNIFRDSTYYGTRTFQNKSVISKIKVTSNVGETDDACINYALPLVKEFLNDTTISMKYDTTVEGYKLYSVLDKDNKKIDSIILEKEEPKAIENTDKSTSIKLETTTDVVPEGTKLVAEEVKSGNNYNTVVKAVENDVEKFVLYDISLVNNNATIQPSGKVKVSIPVPSGYDTSKIVVYRVADDGTKTKYDTTIKEGYITFETDHFSNYVVAEEKAKETTTTNNEKTSTKTETTNTTKRELDNTPKTGEETNVVTVISSVLSLLSMVGIAIVRRF